MALLLFLSATVATCSSLSVRRACAPPRSPGTRMDGPTGGGQLPGLVVLDLDMCVWSPEMYELWDMPSADSVTRGNLNGRGEGVTGVYSGSSLIRMFPGALVALQECHDGVHEGLKLAVASSVRSLL